MFLTQPPCREATVRFIVKQCCREIHDSLHVRDETGIRFGALRDHLRKEADNVVVRRCLHRELGGRVKEVLMCFADVAFEEVEYVREAVGKAQAEESA